MTFERYELPVKGAWGCSRIGRCLLSCSVLPVTVARPLFVYRPYWALLFSVLPVMVGLPE